MKVTELVTHWRTEADSKLADYPSDPTTAWALQECADELESAIEAAVLEAVQTPGAEQCGCGHALAQHGAAGCLAPAPLGAFQTFCVCRRRVTL